MSTIKTLMFQSSDGDLAVSTMQNWRIVISDDATASERYAAEEFQTLFNQATQLKLSLETANKNTDNNDRQIFIKASNTLDDEELDITVDQKQILLSGGVGRGVLYAVYQFLEELVGIRFLTADHIYVPDASELKVPCGRYTYNSSFFLPMELLSRKRQCSRICSKTQSEHSDRCRKAWWQNTTTTHQPLIPCACSFWNVWRGTSRILCIS